MRPRKRRPAPRAELSPDEAARLGRAPETEDFLTGNGFAAHCRYVVNYDGLVVNEHADTDWWFCRVDHLDWFFAEGLPRGPFVLLTHNSDYPIDARYGRQLRRRRLHAWFAANVAVRHPKLIPIPLGVANPGWPHGDAGALREALTASTAKSRLFDVSFALETNASERAYCLEKIGLPLDPRIGHGEYLARLAASYFCIAPRGYGLDTHRIWEALYLRTVPVVTRTVLSDEYPDLPMVVLDDWTQFRAIDFSPDLYDQLMTGWDGRSLSMPVFLERLGRRLGRR
jgi:hypothetical protein